MGIPKYITLDLDSFGSRDYAQLLAVHLGRASLFLCVLRWHIGIDLKVFLVYHLILHVDILTYRSTPHSKNPKSLATRAIYMILDGFCHSLPISQPARGTWEAIRLLCVKAGVTVRAGASQVGCQLFLDSGL